MNSASRSRRKWELGIAGVLIVTAAICSGWICGIFENVPPFPKEFHDQEVRRRIESANKLQDEAIPRGRISYPYYKWEPRSLDKLKYVMSWQPGKVSLQPMGYLGGVRDSGVESPRAGQMTVLLINATDETLGVPSQDGDIYLMLEVKLEGRWHRAQYHGDSWCGNSYGTRSLPPHSYVPILGYQPTAGRVATTRFAINNGAEDILMSAEFEGTYSPDDVAMSTYDALSLRTAGLNKLRAFLLRQEGPSLLPGNLSIDELRHGAWRSLLSGKHDRDAALAVANEVIAFDPTLERRSASLETLMGQLQAALEQESKKKPLVHGFTISNSSAQNHAK